MEHVGEMIVSQRFGDRFVYFCEDGIIFVRNNKNNNIEGVHCYGSEGNILWTCEYKNGVPQGAYCIYKDGKIINSGEYLLPQIAESCAMSVFDSLN